MELGYDAIGPVSEAARTQVRRRADRSRPRGGWWAEGFAFVDPAQAAGPLSGSTKLMLLGAVPAETDMAMALRDAGFIVRRLAWWSLRFRIAWDLTVEGEELGRIRFGIPSVGLVRRLATVAAITRVAAGTPVLFLVRRRALRDHADLWNDPVDCAPTKPPADQAKWELEHRQREAQAAFREGRFDDVLVALSEAEKHGALSVLSERYRSLARRRIDARGA